MDFEIGEYEQRLLQAQMLMHDQGLDALFLASEPEVRYFTGFRTQFWQSPTRPWFVIVPANGPPIAAIPEIGAPLMARTWVEDIRTWSSPHPDDDGISLLKSILKDFRKVGMTMGRESQLRMPLAQFQQLRMDLTATRFINASPLIAELRLVKSEAEIAILAEICSIACDAFHQAPNLFYPGQPLEEAFRTFKIELLRHGAEEVPYLVGGTGTYGYSDVISPPGDEALAIGDVLMLDTGASLKGYFCDFDRNIAIGDPSSEVSKAHETLWLATEAGLGAARPGATSADIFHAMQQVIGSDGSGNVGRYGHGLGMQLTESPSLIDWDQTVMREGVVITLEPSMMVTGGGMLVHEEDIVIRDGEAQLLTRRAPRQMDSV